MSGREEEDSGGGGRGIFRDFGGGGRGSAGVFRKGGLGCCKGGRNGFDPRGSKLVYLEDLYRRFAVISPAAHCVVRPGRGAPSEVSNQTVRRVRAVCGCLERSDASRIGTHRDQPKTFVLCATVS